MLLLFLDPCGTKGVGTAPGSFMVPGILDLVTAGGLLTIFGESGTG